MARSALFLIGVAFLAVFRIDGVASVAAASTSEGITLLSHTLGPLGSIHVAGNYAYAAQAKTWRAFNVSSPTAPVVLGQVVAPNTTDEYYYNGLDYGVDFQGKLWIIDWSNPSSPKVLSKLDTPGWVADVFVSGNLAYISEYSPGISIVDVTTPTAPRLLANLPLAGHTEDTYVVGGIAYVAAGDHFHTVDVSNPRVPRLLYSYHPASPSYAWGIHISGHLAYLSLRGDLMIFDVTNPSAPTLLRRYNTPGDAQHVVVSGGLAYVADGLAGLTILDVSNPTTPTVCAYYPTNGLAQDVCVANGLVYLADDRNGLWIFRYTGPERVPIPPSNLVLTSVSPPQIAVSWSDNSDSELGFKIERKTGVAGAWEQIATTTANVTVYHDSGLLPNVTYLYRVRAFNAAGDSLYSNIITVWDVRADEYPLVFNQQVTGQIETPYSVDRWVFAALSGQQVRFDLKNVSAAGIKFDLKGPGNWTGFQNLTDDSDLITLPTSGTYVLTAHGTGGLPGGAYSFCLWEVALTDLQLGVPYHGQFVGSGHAHSFRLNVPHSVPLKIVLDDASATNRDILYARFGSLPTRRDYDYMSAGSSSGDQSVLVPMATAGTWYILAYCESAAAPSTYTLLATSGVVLTSVTPDHHGNSVDATLTLTGAGFDNATTVGLVGAGGTVYPAREAQADAFTQMTAVFAAHSVPSGRYSVRVSQPDGDSDQLPGAFEMIEGGQPKLETNLVVPSRVGYHAVATVYVEYANRGEVATPAPLLVVTAQQRERQAALLTLDQSRVVKGFWTSAIPEGFSNSVQILASGGTAGVLQPGESQRVPVYYAGWQQPWDFSYPPINFSLGVLTADSTATVSWDALKDGMRPPTITAEAWEPIWANFVTQAGGTWGNYVTMLDNNASYLGRLGERVVDVGELLAFEFQQAEGMSPIRSLASAVDAAVEAPGLPLTFSRIYSQPISRRYELGPLGRGWSHSWHMSLSKAADGTVKIAGPAGSVRTFQPDSRKASYFAQAGDHATLAAIAGGAFTLREPNGLLYAFRADGKLDYVEDTNGNRITMQYTGDLLTRLTHSTGQSLQVTYNGAGRIDQITDHVGRQTLFGYDVSNEHLMSVQNYDGRTTVYAYSLGQGAPKEHALTEIAYPGGTHRYFAYDSQGRLAGISRDGNAEMVSFAYDEAGKVTVTDAAGGVSKSYFNHRGLLVKTEDALGNNVQMSFDNDYNLTRLTDPTGRSHSYDYDKRGNMIRSIDPMGHATRFSYTSSFNRLASVTDARANATNYMYDTKGNLQAIQYADASVERWTYDAAGNPHSRTNRRGRVVGYSYDSAGRITSKTYADGTRVDFTYDPRGNLLTATDTSGTTVHEYWPDDRLRRITYPGGHVLEFTYDAAGRRASSLDQLGHRLDYHYDDVGRLTSLTDERSSEIVHYRYDVAGRLTRKTLGNGVYTTYQYDAAGQILYLINYKPDGLVLSHFDYNYDSRGRRVSMNTNDGRWTYEYDDIGQLIHAVLDSTNPEISDQDLAYVYDEVGNRIRTIENGVTKEYTTNNMNQYRRVGDTTYVFDADGNLTQEIATSGTTTYTYNDENRLNAVRKGTDTWQYTYDPFGNRVATTANSRMTRYVIDPIGLGNLVKEYDNSDNLIAHYDHGFGLLARAGSAGNRVYYAFDAIGSTSHLVNETATVVSDYSYDPFGMPIRCSMQDPNPFRYVGECGVIEGSPGLGLMRVRFYNPAIGRFVKQDPVQIMNRNRYEYAGNNPVSHIDPSGLITSEEMMTIPKAAQEVLEGLQDMLEKGKLYRLPFDFGGVGELAELAGQQLGDPGSVSWDDLSGAAERTLGSLGKKVAGVTRALGYLSVQAEEWLHGRMASRNRIVVKHLPIPPAKDQESGDSGVSSSGDPNQKTGPAGFGPVGHIRPGGVMPYWVGFENEPSATAPAQQAEITDQLDSDLDWSTFELTEIAFGDELISVPNGLSHYETVVPMSYNGVAFEVQVEAGIRYDTGQVYAIFRSIDPNTGLPPSVMIGFLPPEDGTGCGRGQVSYVSKPKPDLPTGTEIRNVALISFDNIDYIATNQVDPHNPGAGTDPNKECLNTIDAGPPWSEVADLPEITHTNPFLVEWSGQDDTGGSGIGRYDIYVSTDGGAFSLWLDDTAATAANFAGVYGRTYAFYSVARDNVGHMEEPPAVPDAQTRLAPLPSPPTLLDEPSFTQGSANGLAWTVVSDAIEYFLEWSEDVSFTAVAGSSGWIAEAAFTATGLSDGQTYFYRVKCRNVYDLESDWSNVVSSRQDASAPVSAVMPLPPLQANPLIQVSWSGGDPNGGSGIRDYTLYASTDGSPFVPIIVNTSATQAALAGRPKHVYAFYSVARDNVGNIEIPPAAPDAVVEIAGLIILADPTSMSLQCPEGRSTSATLLVSNGTSYGTVLDYEIVTTPTGLSCMPTTGTSMGEVTTHTILINPAGLNAGDYAGTITIMAADASGDVFIPVALRVINVLPTVTINRISPNPAQPPLETVTFEGSATDAAGSIARYVWWSSLNGLLSNDALFTTSSNHLTVGNHGITLAAWDDEGTLSSDTIALTIRNALPTARIVSVSPNPIPAGALAQVTVEGQDNDEMGQSLVDGELTWPDGVHAGILPGAHQFAAPLAGGLYTIRYRVCDDEGAWSVASTATIQVLQPVIACEPTSLVLTCAEGESCTGSLVVWNAGGGTLAYIADTTPTQFLHIDPRAGSSAGTQEMNAHVVSWDATTLRPGAFQGLVMLTDPSAANSPCVVPVRVTVTTGPIIANAPTRLSQYAWLGTNASTQSLEVWNAGMGTLGYIAETTPVWLSVMPRYGFSDGLASRTVHQVIYGNNQLPLGDHAATISIVDVAARNNPSTIPVTLRIGWLRVVRPTGGETWLAGTVQEIAWESYGPCDRVDIYLRRPGESRFVESAPNQEGLNSWRILLPQDLTSADDWAVWVCWSSCPEVIRARSGLFRVTPTTAIVVTWPVSDTIWYAGKVGRVTWTCSGFPASGKVYAILWSSWPVYLGQMPFKNGDNSHPIHLPKYIPPGRNYRLILLWAEDLSVFGISEQFEVQLQGRILLPTGRE
jgi:RHS repeat-associated protein